MRFRDKVVLVTGAARNIGRETALAFAREGARVAAVDVNLLQIRDTIADLQEITDQCIWVRASLHLEEEVARMVRIVRERFGRIDVLINNAGGPATERPLEESTPDDWQYAMNGNVRQVFITTKHVLPLMIEHGGGAIVSASTMQAFVACGQMLYQPAKAGITALVRHVAIYYGRHGIRSNCVLPGHINTPTSRLHPDHKSNERNYPGGKLGEISDIVNAYLYLASPESTFVNGTTLFVDGGFTAH